MIQTISEYVLNDLTQAANDGDCLFVANPVGPDRTFAYCPGRSGRGMKATLEVQFDRSAGTLFVRVYQGAVNPIQPGKVKPTKVLNLGFHDIGSEGYLAFRTAFRDLLKPVEEKKPAAPVAIPEDILNGLSLAAKAAE